MNRHLAVTNGRDRNPRWHSAFPQGQLCRSTEVLDQVDSGDCIWVMAQGDWVVLVNQLVGRGAVVTVMTYQPASTEAIQALAAGARGYVHALSPAALLQRVATVISHQGLWVGSELLTQVAGATFKALGGGEPNTDCLAGLTVRERAVALAEAEGRSNKEVARELDITERTVKAHLSGVFRKLGVRDRLQLVRVLTTRNG